MPDFVRSTPASRALILVALCVGAATPTAAQSTPDSASRSASSLVVVLSARAGAIRSPRIADALGGREVVSIYTTDASMAYDAAAKVHTTFGGSLIPYDRRSRAADDFASLLVRNAVDHAARQHPGQAVLVVVEQDLMLPFLHHATGKPIAGLEPDTAGADGFRITISPNGDRTATRLPLRGPGAR
jgi:hypothetical protein